MTLHTRTTGWGPFRLPGEARRLDAAEKRAMRTLAMLRREAGGDPARSDAKEPVDTGKVDVVATAQSDATTDPNAAPAPHRRRSVVELMPMDLIRSGANYLALFDVPGADSGSIDVSIDGNLITVRARRTRPVGDNSMISERRSGAYARELVVSEGVVKESITAT